MAATGLGGSRRRVAGAVAASVLAAAVIVGGLLKATPEVYRRTAPMGADPDAADQFNERVVNQVGNVLLDKSGGTALDIEVTEAMVNARVAQFLADEARAGKPVPPVLSDLRVGFEPGRLVLATRVGRGVSGAVVSQALHLSADAEGNLCVEPAGTSAGLLPLPEGVVGYVRRAVAAEVNRRRATAAADETLDLWAAVLGGLEGQPVPLGKGRKRIVLEQVEVDRGVLRMSGRRADAPAK